MSESPRVVTLAPAKVIRALVGIAILLALFHVALVFVKIFTGHDYIHGLVPLFNLDNERNVPSFFSGCLFLFNALLFALVARAPAGSASRRTWSVLATVFVFLAYDELFSVHESLTVPVRTALHTSGLLYYAWVLVYLPVVALVGLLFLPVWRRLERPARLWLAMAAVTYLVGAAGIEMIGGAYFEAARQSGGPIYDLLVALEESLEMAGLIMLTHGLVGLLAQEAGGPVILIQDRD